MCISYIIELKDGDIMLERIAEIKAELKYIETHKNVLEDLIRELEELDRAVKEKESILLKENKDVEELEKMSFQSLFHSILGDKDEKLIKERYEASRASLEYQRVLQEYNFKKQDADKLQKRIDQYDNLYKELEELQLQIHYNQPEILRLKEQKETIQYELKELDEAISTGKMASDSLWSLEVLLSKANDWSTFDMFSDSMLADIMKRENLSKAQQQLQVAKGKLLAFERELQDVNINQLNVPELDGFDFVMDFFFDNIFFDYTIKSRIKDSLTRVRQVIDKVDPSLKRLKETRIEKNNSLESINNQIKEELMKL